MKEMNGSRNDVTLTVPKILLIFLPSDPFNLQLAICLILDPFHRKYRWDDPWRSEHFDSELHKLVWLAWRAGHLTDFFHFQPKNSWHCTSHPGVGITLLPMPLSLSDDSAAVIEN